MTFALSEEQFGDPETHDLNSKVFWDKLSEMLKLTYAMLRETAEQKGIDLDGLDVKAAANEEKNNWSVTENHKCSHIAKTYADMVEEWFESANDLFIEKTEELKTQIFLELPGSNSQSEALNIKDSTDIIRWYQHQIYVKVKRAVSGLLRNTIDEDPKDSDGSAKVALIAADRSIAAWGQIYKHFPEQKDSIINILAHLDLLRKEIESTFPNARRFIRAGFDDTHNQS
jgi:hypothetical protein